MLPFFVLLNAVISQSDVDDRLEVLEAQVDYNTRELVLLRCVGGHFT